MIVEIDQNCNNKHVYFKKTTTITCPRTLYVVHYYTYNNRITTILKHTLNTASALADYFPEGDLNTSNPKIVHDLFSSTSFNSSWYCNSKIPS